MFSVWRVSAEIIKDIDKVLIESDRATNILIWSEKIRLPELWFVPVWLGVTVVGPNSTSIEQSFSKLTSVMQCSSFEGWVRILYFLYPVDHTSNSCTLFAPVCLFWHKFCNFLRFHVSRCAQVVLLMHWLSFVYFDDHMNKANWFACQAIQMDFDFWPQYVTVIDGFCNWWSPVKIPLVRPDLAFGRRQGKITNEALCNNCDLDALLNWLTAV